MPDRKEAGRVRCADVAARGGKIPARGLAASSHAPFTLMIGSAASNRQKDRAHWPPRHRARAGRQPHWTSPALLVSGVWQSRLRGDLQYVRLEIGRSRNRDETSCWQPGRLVSARPAQACGAGRAAVPLATSRRCSEALPRIPMIRRRPEPVEGAARRLRRWPAATRD